VRRYATAKVRSKVVYGGASLLRRGGGGAAMLGPYAELRGPKPAASRALGPLGGVMSGTGKAMRGTARPAGGGAVGATGGF